ncbi:MAG TPA: hypothetical protein VG963_29820, partial [Polyangiaceae bacterium]|nr:hypothetical protein [Polyangiaceae bacterium]
TTPCGVQTCSAGQYCDNSLCSNGCLSDDNCASNQSCDKQAGENVGTCQTHGTADKDCPAYVRKCVACGGDNDECQRQCDVANAECTSCVVSQSGCILSSCINLCQF